MSAASTNPTLVSPAAQTSFSRRQLLSNFATTFTGAVAGALATTTGNSLLGPTLNQTGERMKERVEGIRIYNPEVLALFAATASSSFVAGKDHRWLRDHPDNSYPCEWAAGMTQQLEFQGCKVLRHNPNSRVYFGNGKSNRLATTLIDGSKCPLRFTDSNEEQQIIRVTADGRVQRTTRRSYVQQYSILSGKPYKPVGQMFESHPNQTMINDYLLLTSIPIDNGGRVTVVAGTHGVGTRAIEQLVLTDCFLPVQRRNIRDAIESHRWVQILVAVNCTTRIDAGKNTFMQTTIDDVKVRQILFEQVARKGPSIGQDRGDQLRPRQVGASWQTRRADGYRARWHFLSASMVDLNCRDPNRRRRNKSPTGKGEACRPVRGVEAWVSFGDHFGLVNDQVRLANDRRTNDRSLIARRALIARRSSCGASARRPRRRGSPPAGPGEAEPSRFRRRCSRRWC